MDSDGARGFLFSPPQLFHPLSIYLEATCARQGELSRGRGRWDRERVQTRGGGKRRAGRGKEGGGGEKRNWQRRETSQPVQPSLQPCPQGLDPLTNLFSPLGPCPLSLHGELFIFAVASFHSVRVSSGLWELSRPWSLLSPGFGQVVS